MASTSASPTVTFKSIDGPPPQVFDRMVGVLDSESKLRSLSIVPRRHRLLPGEDYLSAQVNHGRATIAWVWDVYDRDQQRASPCRRGAGWQGRARRLDGGRRPGVAENRAGRLSGLTAMINRGGPDAPGPAPAPDKRSPAVASAEAPAPAASEFSVSALAYTDH